MRVAIAAVLVGGLGAEAQDLQPGRIYLEQGSLVASTRVVGLGGAYAGVAEGADGFTSNLAVVAHRDPTLDRNWDFDWTIAWLTVPVGSGSAQDFDNSGQATLSQGGGQVLLGAMFQYKRFGVGLYFRTSSQAFCPSPPCGADADYIQATLVRTVLGVGYSFFDGDWVLAAGIFDAGATFDWQSQSWVYSRAGVEGDLLYRPKSHAYRFGLSVKPQVYAPYSPSPGQVPVIAGRTLYQAVVSPGLVSVGFSHRLGEGAENYNRLSPVARREMAASPPPAPEAPLGRWLVSGQLDLIWPTANAVPVQSFFNQTPQFVGSWPMLEPRFGLEHDTILHRLRLRGGTYLEPSAYSGQSYRPHFTAGFELNLFHVWEDWEISGAFDGAPRYANLSLSIGWWH